MIASTLATIPEGLDLVTKSDGVTIRRRWFNWTVGPLAIFAVVWDSFLWFWYSTAFRSPNAPIIEIIFPLGHVAVGVFVTYSVFTTLLNKTDVDVSSVGVRVTNDPLPSFGNKVVRFEEISGVLVRPRLGNRNSTTYDVMYVDRNRKERKLIGSVPQSDQAEFTAETIRQRLGLRAVGS